jgi:hypothetical protein
MCLPHLRAKHTRMPTNSCPPRLLTHAVPILFLTSGHRPGLPPALLHLLLQRYLDVLPSPPVGYEVHFGWWRGSSSGASPHPWHPNLGERQG